ncbi:hypothetical protein ACWEFL_24940 [Streptomyces sp. NPDC004838]
MPLSPLEIFSVSRLVRALHWATLGADARRYPHRVRASAAERELLGECAWLEPGDNGVAVLRAPRPDERDHLPALLTGARARQGGGATRNSGGATRQGGGAARHDARRLRELRTELEEAARTTALLETCPVCARPDPRRPTEFEPRDGGLFAASCPACLPHSLGTPPLPRLRRRLPSARRRRPPHPRRARTGARPPARRRVPGNALLVPRPHGPRPLPGLSGLHEDDPRPALPPRLPTGSGLPAGDRADRSGRFLRQLLSTSGMALNRSGKTVTTSPAGG